jgi:hypothetical protein
MEGSVALKWAWYTNILEHVPRRAQPAAAMAGRLEISAAMESAGLGRVKV